MTDDSEQPSIVPEAPESGVAERRRAGRRLEGLEGTLREAKVNGRDVAEAFAAYSAEAFARGDLIDRAVEFLLDLFADDEAELARLVRVPDLATELAHGGAALTCTVASHWNANVEVARLAHLADVMRSAHVQMKSPHAVEVMLVLAASLGVTRPSRARSLLGIASLRATPGDHDEALRQARLWVSAGEVVEDAPVEERTMWDQRLRNRTRAYSWDSIDERRALSHIADRLDPESAVGALFQSVTPECWWDLLMKRHHDDLDRTKRGNDGVGDWAGTTAPSGGDQDLEVLKEGSIPVSPSVVTTSEPVGGASNRTSAPRRWPWFLLGMGLGGIAVAAMMERGQTAVQTTTPKAIESAVLPADSVVVQNPHLGGDWCDQERARLMEALIDPAMLNAVRGGRWIDHEIYLRGQTSRMPQGSDQYLIVLRLLHLDLPRDPEMVRALPRLLALRGIDNNAVELWEHVRLRDKQLCMAIQQVVSEILEAQGGSVPSDLRARMEALAANVD